MLTLIFTERLNEMYLELETKRCFPDGFTILKAIGYWEDVKEKSLVIMIAGDIPESAVKAFCNTVKGINKQECLMVVTLPGNVSFI